METILICGLGNPGEKFNQTVHNAGFLALDVFAMENEFPELKLSKNFNSLISEKNLFGKRIILAKPQTFMNESGKALKKLISFYKIPPENIYIIHDDTDLPIGKIKISQNRGSAGHNGVESIIKETGLKNFTRFRVGARSENAKPGVAKARKIVLKKLMGNDLETAEKSFYVVTEAVGLAAFKNIEAAMNEFNK
jgi:peptidyl-tRNA hydrolase, PTH1 family